MILLDTDHLSIVAGRSSGKQVQLVARLRDRKETLAVPVVAVEEQCKGWLAFISRKRNVHEQVHGYDELRAIFLFFRHWDIQPFDLRAAEQFDDFRKQRIRVGSRDLKIAAIAVTQNALLLSANLGDFRQVPGLRVENWLEGRTA